VGLARVGLRAARSDQGQGHGDLVVARRARGDSRQADVQPRALMIAPAGARRILLFTGAGISTNSGIPDFRGPNGIWQKRQPVYFDEFLNSDAKRREYWEYKLEGYPLFVAARPNATHAAIVALEKLGRVQAVVTQNIDGLHQAAGSSEALVVELHGTNAWIECVQCEARSEPAPAFAA